MTGSDTMVNLAQAWSEAYQKSHPDVSAQVRGGGSGVGIAALINGKADIAPSSRAMEPDEIELAKKNTGKEPKQFIVGTDALAVYVHKDNPLDAISIEELAAVYGEGGKISKWQELGVENPACSGGEIVRVSRQNNSGTYVYFRDVVLGKDGNYKQGTTAQSGSSDVVALVSSTPCAIGYSGMGYNDPGKVKMLKVSKKKGEPGVAPTLATALDGTYPIARPLYIYTLGEPTGAVQEFIQWTLGPEGQAIVEKVGYVPNVKSEEPAKEEAKAAEEKPAEESKPAEAAESPAAEAAPTEPAPAADAAKPE
jgi:phosphate transport system substrate-binding protein